ncbi:hypothetical protein, partial [Streptomyces sp. NRRL F-5630]|uniref:hypothetical protein n=1 Tax=Streptomyces sp. NRRL F-5630 TaxID=1463864 RepID=UPI003D7388E2
RTECVKSAPRAIWTASTALPSAGIRVSIGRYPTDQIRGIARLSSQESTMADLAFVATMLAVFALVALVAKGVTKL